MSKLHNGFARFLHPRRQIDRIVGDRLDLRRRRFEKAARSGAWTTDGESVSGDGSSLAATEQLRSELPDTLRRLGVKSLLDVPCGDWNWMSQVELPVERYIGGDIVAFLVDRNTERFARPGVEFRVIDLCADALPSTDMVLCRDVWIHFCERDIWRAVANIERAGITWLATTTFVDTSENTDISTGIDWRPLNVMAPPFSFPDPEVLLVDDFNRPDQRLGVWRVADLPVVSGASSRRR